MEKFFLAIIIIIHSFILTKVIFFPYPELFIYPYLTNQGLKPYSQILDQHFPGLLFLPINFDNLGMATPDIARLWLIVTVIITQLLLFFISKKIFKSEKKAILVNLLYLIWQPFFEGWVLWIDSLLPLFLLPAFYFLYKSKFLLTGLFLGITIVFKQVTIPLALLAGVYILWKNKKIKYLATYSLGLSIPIIFMLFYIFSIGVFKDFWYWTVIFNLSVYAKYGRGAVADFAHISRVALVFGVSFLILRNIKDRTVQILLIFLGGSLIGLSTRFDFVHFQPALPFAVLATVYGLRKILIIGYMLIAIWWLNIFYKGHIGDKIFFFDTESYVIAEKVKQYTNPGEKIFVFGVLPHLYQMTETLPAGDIFVFQFPWFLKIAEDGVLEGLKKDVPKIVVEDRNAEIEGQKISDYAKKLDQYIKQNYEVIDQVGTTAILRRKN